MPSSPSLRPAPTISTLPTEILTSIVVQLDRSSAISLSRVARVFPPVTDFRIYRDLDLSLPWHWGKHPLVLPHAPETPEGQEWVMEEAGRVEERHRKGLRDKVNGILRRAGERRLGMVENVVVVPRPGAVHAILSLLENISSSLKTLRLEPAHNLIHGRVVTCEARDSFDVKLIDYNLSLAALTHLHITKNSALYPETAVTLCKGAPNLVSLSAEFFGRPRISHWDNDLVTKPPGHDTVLSMPRLLYIKVSFENRDGEDGKHPLVAILRGSPAVRQLALQYWGYDVGSNCDLIKLLSEKADLQDLYINIGPLDLLEYSSGGRASGFPSLRRLALESCDCTDVFERCITLPCLEVVHIYRPDEAFLRLPQPAPFSESTTPPFTMLPSLVRDLCDAPRLSIINVVDKFDFEGDIFGRLDDIEAAGNLTGHVRSFVHGEEELLHVRFLSQYGEVGDYPRLEMGEGDCWVDYTARDGSERRRVFIYLREAEWFEYAEIDGLKVPIQILAQMRKVKRAKLEAWQGRRVEVGNKAWAVLTEWRDGRNAATSS